MAAPKSQTTLKTSYNSPTNAPFSFVTNLPSQSDKTAYLSSLRNAIAETQEQINKELTSRMEDDKATAAAKGAPTKDDATEEDNYGEEVPEED